MAHEAGGTSAKFGDRYEATWVAYQLLQLLEEKISSVTVEAIGDEEVGVDLIIEHNNGNNEYHQCKSSHGFDETWSLASLNQANVLNKAFFQIKRTHSAFHIVSPLPSKLLNDLRESALNSNESIADFYNLQIKSSVKRKKEFDKLCGYLNLDASKAEDLKLAKQFLKYFEVTP